MMRKKLSQSYLLISELITILFLFAVPASATTWTDWTSVSAGEPGSASGLLGGVAVSYKGEIDNIWAPDSSFIGGTVTTSPPNTVDDVIFLNGSFTGTNTITFATPLVNPLLAIWSLGSSSLPASLIFNATPNFEAGGPNSIYGGQPITVSGNTVEGNEGNGVVQFTGTSSLISWTNPSKDFYGFTIGQAAPVTVSQVPEIDVGAGGAGLTVLAIALLLASERRSRPS